MTQQTKCAIRLVIFDGDDTLWHCMDAPAGHHFALSDRGSGPGYSHFTFAKISEHVILRDDGYRFQLFQEVPGILCQLSAARRYLSLASYNYAEPVFRALEAFGIRGLFRHPVAAWTPRKDLMIKLILDSFKRDRESRARVGLADVREKPIERSEVVLADNSKRYERHAERVGVQFFHVQTPEDLLKLTSEILAGELKEV